MKAKGIFFGTCLYAIAAVAIPSPSVAKGLKVSIGGDAGAGTYSMIASAMAKVVNDKIKTMEVIVETTPGGGVGNIRRLGGKEIEFGVATSDSATNAIHGMGDFSGARIQNIRLALNGLRVAIHVAVPGKSSIQSVKDLKGKRIVTTSAASATTYVPHFLEAHGLNKGDYKLVHQAVAAAVDAFKDGHVDAVVGVTLPPSNYITELCSTKGARLVPPDAKALEVMIKKHGFYSSITLPGGMYTGQSAEYKTVALFTNLYTHADVPEKVVYDFVKSVLENEKQLVEIYRAAKPFNAANQKEILSSARDVHKLVPPIHSGALKYFREVGIVK